MDCDSDLVQINGALLKANNVHPFKYISSRGGNENEINNVVDILYDLLFSKRYINEERIINRTHENTLRKIQLFLILNADIKVLDDLANSNDIGHLVWTTPLLTKCLLIHLVWGLNLDKFYCETVQYGGAKLSLELLKIGSQNMKYSSLEKSLKRVNNLVTAAYGMTCNLLYKDSQNDSQKDILNNIFDNVVELMKFFGDSPNKSKMNDWDTDELYVFAGKTVHNLFDLLIKCFTMYLERQQESPFEMYSYIHMGSENDGLPKEMDKSSDMVEDYLNKYNELLIHVTKTNVMAVAVDVYCSWCEIQDEEESDKTLQRAVGELAFKLHQIMGSDERLNSDLVSMLEPISCKPLELSDIIRDADGDTILQKAGETGVDQKDWLVALSKMENLFMDQEAIIRINENINLLSREEYIMLFKSSVDILFSKIKPEHALDIKKLLHACFDMLDLENEKIIVKTLFIERNINNELELPGFNCDITEFYNKLIDFDDSVMPGIMRMFIQNPQQFYIRAIEQCYKNSKASAILDALEFCKEFYTNKFEYNIILNALELLKIDTLNTDFEKKSFVTLIKELFLRNIIEKEIILSKYLLPSIDTYIRTKNLSNLLIYLECMKEIYSIGAIEICMAPVVVLFAQILELIRWDLSDYSMEAVNVIEVTIELQQAFIEDFTRNKQTTDKEWLWIVRKLSHLTPINAIYFKKLIQQDNMSLLDMSLSDSELKLCLCYLLPRSTLGEIRGLFSLISKKYESAPSFILLCDVVKLIIQKAKEINTEFSFGCLGYICRCLAIILQDGTILKNYAVFQEIISLMNLIPENIYEETFNCFLSLNSHILNSLNTEGDLTLENILKTIETMNNETSKDMLKRLLKCETD